MVLHQDSAPSLATDDDKSGPPTAEACSPAARRALTRRTPGWTKSRTCDAGHPGERQATHQRSLCIRPTAEREPELERMRQPPAPSSSRRYPTCAPLSLQRARPAPAREARIVDGE